MKACAAAVHAVEMFNYTRCRRQIAAAVWALVIELFTDELFVLFVIDLEGPVLADAAAQFVEKHTDELVRDVGLRPSRGGA